MNDASPVDICLFGATGFAGRLTARHLADRCGPAGLRLAVAGRSRERLEAIAADLPMPVEILTADTEDATSLDRLARESRVVCSTVGPYAQYGTPLVDACVRHGTDYLDLTGEVPWMRRSIDAFHDRAVQSGSRIVHACGFDSLPSDIGVLLAQEELRRRDGAYAGSLELRMERASGGFSRGTLDSMLLLIRAAVRDRRTRRILADPRSLEPGWPGSPSTSPGDEIDAKGPRSWKEATGAWSIPFFMDSVNGKVVRRSHALAGYPYGRDFAYREVIPLGRGFRGFTAALLGRALFGAAVLLLVLPPTRFLLARFVFPRPRSGPKAALEGRGGFHLTVRNGASGAVVVEATAERDPGYGATAIMLAESALLLAETRGAARPGGVLTPAIALGLDIVPRLAEAGVWIRSATGTDIAEDGGT